MTTGAARTGRRDLAALALALAAPAVSAGTHVGEVELLVPGPPGSVPDRWARGAAPFLERAWPRQKLVLRNLPGRGGLAMVAELAAAPQGHRMIGAPTTPLLLARAVEAGEPSPFERIQPLAALVEESVVLVAAPGGANDIDRLRTDASAAPLGAPPPGTSAHVTAQRLSERLSLPLLAFPSAAAARGAALAGHVSAAALTMPDAIGFLRDGRLVALGVAASRRSPLLPDAPTLRESGLELLAATRRGFALPPGAPPEWRFWLLSGLEKIAADPDLAAYCAENGQVPRFLGPSAWAGLLIRQENELRRLWRDAPWLPRRD